MPKRRSIRELTLAELEEFVVAAQERKFRAAQIMNCVWQRNIGCFEQMHQVPQRLRDYLAGNFIFDNPAVAQVARAEDGTRKFVLQLSDGEEIESVIIPGQGRTTLCLSSQAGCAMACEFCATALMGLHRNLTAGEILGQIVAARQQLECAETLTNYVFMGMGEPLANYPRLRRTVEIMTAPWGLAISPRRITVSTVGLVSMMDRLLEDFPVNLAVSLHATTNQLRDRLVPLNRRFPLEMLLSACARLPLARRRRITFEYVMLAGVNDSKQDAKRLVKLLSPLRAKVNLIFFNQFAGSPFTPSSRTVVQDFQAILQQGNVTATIRESRGRDIAAACGQLYAERNAGRIATYA
jgi:23S rRNA (adenine2503-C2)-methyltransferase